jgi:hypothetical protein
VTVVPVKAIRARNFSLIFSKNRPAATMNELKSKINFVLRNKLTELLFLHWKTATDAVHNATTAEDV